MPRQPRYPIVGMPQHGVQRGNDRQATLFADGDYRSYLDCLSDAGKRHECHVHALVLMTNHVHRLMTPQRPGAIARVMQSVGRRYVQHVNHLYRGSGALWEGRYKASLVDSERYSMTCYRCIELNPVRASMVPEPSEYRWSSYRAHALGGYDRPLRRCARLIAARRPAGVRSMGSSAVLGFRSLPRRAGVIAARCLLLGANTP